MKYISCIADSLDHEPTGPSWPGQNERKTWLILASEEPLLDETEIKSTNFYVRQIISLI